MKKECRDQVINIVSPAYNEFCYNQQTVIMSNFYRPQTEFAER